MQKDGQEAYKKFMKKEKALEKFIEKVEKKCLSEIYIDIKSCQPKSWKHPFCNLKNNPQHHTIELRANKKNPRLLFSYRNTPHFKYYESQPIDTSKKQEKLEAEKELLEKTLKIPNKLQKTAGKLKNSDLEYLTNIYTKERPLWFVEEETITKKIKDYEKKMRGEEVGGWEDWF